MDHQPQKDQNSGQASTSPAAISAAETDNQTPAADKLAKKKSSSSSSSSGNIDEEDDFFQIEGPILGSTISFGHNAPSIAEQSGAGSGSSPKQSPPGVQAMSRASPADERVIVPDPKRIPSSVFARSRSTSPPTDWSVTSNESLFSINVGNASFSRDHFFLYGKSGDMMGNPNDPLAPLPPLPRPSTSSAMSLARSGDQDGGAKTTTAVQAGAKLKPAAAVAAKEGDDRDDGDGNADYNHCLSHRSDASTTSFAFPILAGGDVKSSGSLKDDSPELARQSTSQLSQQAEPVEQEAPKVIEAKAPEVEQAPEPESAPPPASAAAEEPAPQQPAPAKWFPCCSCCPFCC